MKTGQASLWPVLTGLLCGCLSLGGGAALESGGEIALPEVEVLTLSNGMVALVADVPRLPTVTLKVIAPTGESGAAAGDLPWITAHMLSQGSERRSGLEIALTAAFMGSHLDTDLHFGQTHVGMTVSPADMAAAVELVAEVMGSPQLPEEALEWAWGAWARVLAERRDDPSQVADNFFARVTVGSTSSGVDAPAPDGATVSAFHRSRYLNARTIVIVTGPVRGAMVAPMLERTFGRWILTGGSEASRGTAVFGEGPVIHVRDRPWTRHAEVRVGSVLRGLDASESAAMDVLLELLGGSVGRLTDRARREGFAFSVNARREMGDQGESRVTLSAVTEGGNVGRLVTAITEEITLMTRSPAPAQEVAAAASMLQTDLLMAMRDSHHLAGVIARLWGVEGSDFGLRPRWRALAQVTPQSLQEVARRYLDPAGLVVVVVGDRAIIEAPLRQIGVGPVRIAP